MWGLVAQSNSILTFTPPESFPSGQFWGIYALIWGVRVKQNSSDRNEALRPDGCMFESQSSHHVETLDKSQSSRHVETLGKSQSSHHVDTLGKSFTRSCL